MQVASLGALQTRMNLGGRIAASVRGEEGYSLSRGVLAGQACSERRQNRVVVVDGSCNEPRSVAVAVAGRRM